MSVLVFKGHETRGLDLLALLKSLGDLDGLSVIYPQNYYYVSKGKVLVTSNLVGGLKWSLFSLEDFEDRYPYKVGDKVMYGRELHFVKGLEWNGEEIRYKIDYGDGYFLTNIKVEELKPYKVKEEVKKENEHLILDCVSTDKGHEIVPHEGYEIKQEGDKFYLVERKPKYPNTYEECLEILGHNAAHTIPLNHGHKGELFMRFQRLLVLRDAYWKFAGGWSFKMGNDSKDVVYAISVYGSGIMRDFYRALSCNRILVFPTEEMRDAFYKNFKELIESCKELL